MNQEVIKRFRYAGKCVSALAWLSGLFYLLSVLSVIAECAVWVQFVLCAVGVFFYVQALTIDLVTSRALMAVYADSSFSKNQREPYEAN